MRGHGTPCPHLFGIMTQLTHLLITSGDDNAVSFSDETSTDSRVTGKYKVCITGQVDRNLSLDWYYDIIALFPDAPGELKSKVVTERFNNFPSNMRAKIWAGLKKVKIHVVDPQPHGHKLENMLRSAWRSSDAPERLDRMAREGIAFARGVLEELRYLLADSILRDSTAVRVQHLARALSEPLFGSMFSDTGTNSLLDSELQCPQVITADDFPNRKSLVRDVTSWSAKSSAAFHSVLEAPAQVIEENNVGYFYADNIILQRRMTKELSYTHAFDKGNEKQLHLLERARHSMIRELANRDHMYVCSVPRLGFVGTESRDSYYTQAADIAAGMASDLYEKEGLIGIVDRWEYVAFNGARVSRSDAEEEMRKLRSLDV